MHPPKLALFGQGYLAQAIAQVAPTPVVFSRHATLEPQLLHADVWIDASHPSQAYHNATIAFQAKKPLITATTGHNLQPTSAPIPWLLIPNLSPFMQALFHTLPKLLDALPPTAHCHEIHAYTKKDTPSGTALLWKKYFEKQGKQLTITSERRRASSGQHTFSWDGPGEQLIIAHTTSSRLPYGHGAWYAAQWLIQQPPGVYGIQHLSPF